MENKLTLVRNGEDGAGLAPCVPENDEFSSMAIVVRY